ncbi:ATP synthase complex subunit H-domain-containing protein [Phanerochaete sordida]|uniref:ATP synthase complex subunit H-domain-containing protein n=1 Tax=Phanerochaete sordida TaxID=48140 RepID=A0A9P3GJT7_9APHY|nr:ATP synthase complex subunit H-domain-containing protein [Phanerochaete sordida]
MSSSLLRQAARATRAASRSCAFSTSSVVRKDLIQDLYIKELKGYKPAPAAKDAHVGAVKAYSLPPKPQAPALPADLASELSAYDAAEPTKAESSAAAEPVAESKNEAEAFLELCEREPNQDHHSHH